MLRTALRPLTRPQQFAGRRTFVSPVLLTKTWENVPLAVLRREASCRGLSLRGNKPTLIARIQEHEKHGASSRVSFSTGVTPGTRSPPTDFFLINLPDLSKPDPEPEVQVPYLPDFWDSKPSKTSPVIDPPLPKLVLVAGADTHHGGGPSHNLHDEHGKSAYLTDLHIVPTPTAPVTGTTTGGLYGDVMQDIGLPATFGVKNLFPPTTRKDRYLGQSRELDENEKRGVWILLGLLAGSYVVAGLVNGKAKKKDH